VIRDESTDEIGSRIKALEAEVVTGEGREGGSEGGRERGREVGVRE
jgi:hypothetical protein